MAAKNMQEHPHNALGDAALFHQVAGKDEGRNGQ
jgi:hypothetical protein